ncbi:MAG: asparaginyl/glutamyl-tRNA amidotransferase subunit C [Candidatus Yanofskybacteria bacterium RIFCSPLOWO2_01_FULL_49_25]|uniref:Aspartyl/glutamyl-tRNA(Asn/Gln) amidotransferase subunit C n=1 Tax=Candidatus Yanofskybacteria bacterium RIFCSPLOWO2_01_FULL_49_25 TaxID=1802701 RepID=A0A1F8GTN4_9BACT|nr:MAG: asparaginyl/glutamyl-tRNA amidotransferase subunit C [Candidatus Yanofskybacteria bacterium RIFCSPLOWO2_01_FULL_49_25]
MSDITREEVEKIAMLARIKLTDAEKAKLTGELGSILTYVSKLNEIDTTGVEPTAQVTGLENVFRPDDIKNAIEPGTYTEAVLSQAPERDGDYVKVKGVMEGK